MRADRGIIPLAIDLTERDEFRTVIEDLKIDALAHAALRCSESTRFRAQKDADIDMSLEVKLSAIMRLTNAVVRLMMAEGRRSILILKPDPGDGLLKRRAEDATRTSIEALGVDEAGIAVACARLGQVPFEDIAHEVAETLAAGLENTSTDDTPEAVAHRQKVRKLHEA